MLADKLKVEHEFPDIRAALTERQAAILLPSRPVPELPPAGSGHKPLAATPYVDAEELFAD